MKAFIKIISVVVLLLIIALFFMWMFKTPLLSSYLSKKMGVDVSIEQVELSTSQTKLSNLEVDNLPRYRSSKALTIGEVLTNYSLKGLRAKPTYVELVRLQDMTITLECNDPLCSNNNWETIMSGMDKGSGGDYLIRKVEIVNLRIDILGSGIKPGGVVTTRINRLDFNNVTSKEGIPLKQIITDIFIRANMQKYFKELMKQPQQMLQDALPGFKLGAAGGVIPSTTDAVDEPAKKKGFIEEEKEKFYDERSRGAEEETERAEEERKKLEEEQKKKLEEQQEKLQEQKDKLKEEGDKATKGYFGADVPKADLQDQPAAEEISQEATEEPKVEEVAEVSADVEMETEPAAESVEE